MTAMKFRAGPIWLLGVGMVGITLLWQIYNAYVPIFLQAGRPDFTRGAGVRGGFALDTATTGFIMTLDNIAALVILPWVGALSDRIRTRWGRRKPFIVIGAPVAALAFAVIPFTPGQPLAVFMSAIALMLLAMDLFRTPITALMADLTPPPQRSFANGILYLMSGLGAVLAFAAGGWLFARGTAAPFLFGTAGLLLACLIVLALVPEPERPEAPDESPPGVLASLGALARDPERSALRLLLTIFFAYIGTSGMEVFFTSFAVNEFAVDSGRATMLLSFFALAGVVGALPTGYVGVRFGRRRTMLTGLFVLIGLVLIVYGTHSLAALRLLLVLLGLAWSLFSVNALPMVLDLAAATRAGAYTGLFFLATQLASVAGPVLAGRVLHLTGSNYRVLFLHISVMLAIAFVLMLGVRRGEAAA